MLPSTRVSIIDTNSTEGGNSMLLDYSIKYLTKTSHKVVLEKDFKFMGEPDSIYIDIYSNGNGHVINLQLEDADHENFGISSKGDFLNGKYGWQPLSFALNSIGERFNYPAKLKKITVYTIQQNAKTDSSYSGKILIDNLRAHYKSLTNVSGKENLEEYVLFQNYPNPFNSNTTIKYKLAQESRIQIRVFNILGETVKHVNAFNDAGYNYFDINMSGLSSGIYLYNLEVQAPDDNIYFRSTKKMLYLK